MLEVSILIVCGALMTITNGSRILALGFGSENIESTSSSENAITSSPPLRRQRTNFNDSTSNPLPPRPSSFFGNLNAKNLQRSRLQRVQPTTSANINAGTKNSTTTDTAPNVHHLVSLTSAVPQPTTTLDVSSRKNTSLPLQPPPRAPTTTLNLDSRKNKPIQPSPPPTHTTSYNTNFQSYLQSYLQATSNSTKTTITTTSLTTQRTNLLPSYAATSSASNPNPTSYINLSDINLQQNRQSRPRSTTSINPKFQIYLEKYLQAVSNSTKTSTGSSIDLLPPVAETASAISQSINSIKFSAISLRHVRPHAQSIISVNLNAGTDHLTTIPSAPSISELPSSSDTDSTFSDFDECNICFIEYDEKIRKPKRLPCNHIVCLLCLMVIYSVAYIIYQSILNNVLLSQELRQTGNVFSCPFCRHLFNQENVDELPDNTLYFPQEESSTDEPYLELDTSKYQTDKVFSLYCRLRVIIYSKVVIN